MTGVAVAIAVIGAGASIYQGERAASAQKKAAVRQEQAQRQSFLSSVTEDRLAAQRENAANKRRPDVSSILGEESRAAGRGPGSTILAGRGGGKPLLGGATSLMGG